MRLFKKIEGKKGIALIMALWIMTILLVVAASFAFMMRTEIKMAKNYRDGMKAHYLALAGVEHAIAVLETDTNQVDHLYEDWFTTFATGINYTNVTWDAAVKSFGGGTYAVNLSDENSKYNLNYPNRSGLQYLVAINNDATSVIWQGKICGIKDYADSDLIEQDWAGTVRGYELAGVTQKLFDTVYEIQKVRGYLAGGGYGIVKINDGFWDGVKIYDNPLDPPSVGSRGQQSDMTVYSQDRNTQVGGSARTEIKGASQVTFDGLGFTSEEAYSIAAVSGTFIDHTYPWTNEPATTEGVGAPGWATATLQTEISSASMILAGDKMTAGSYGGDNVIEATVNINTATLYGIQTLFNIAGDRGQAIINTRNDTCTCKGSDGEIGGTGAAADVILSSVPLPDYTGAARGSSNRYFANRGEILMVYDPSIPGSSLSRGYFQDYADFVTVRSDRFRIYSIGKVGIDGNGDDDLEDSVDTVFAARKIEAVVNRDFHDDGAMGPITILYWSEKAFAD